MVLILIPLLVSCGDANTNKTSGSTPSLSPLEAAIRTACLDVQAAFADGSILKTGKIDIKQRAIFRSAALKFSEASRINAQYLDAATIALAASQGDYSGFTPSRNIRTLQALCLGVS
jgi:hypothetical protein